MKSKPYLAAVRDAARVIDVPGAPKTLRLDDVQVVGESGGKGGRVTLTWSFGTRSAISVSGNRAAAGSARRAVVDRRGGLGGAARLPGQR